MSTQSLSTDGYSALLRRSLTRAGLVSTGLVGAIFALAFGPMLARDPQGFAQALGRSGALHAPDFAPLAHAPLAIQVHLATVVVALGVTVILLSGVKGSRLHRTLGWVWAGSMVVTAIAALLIPFAPVGPHIGPIGFLQLFALATLISVPRAVLAARRHDVARHAAVLSGLIVGGLGLAGLSAFIPGRLMWTVFFG